MDANPASSATGRLIFEAVVKPHRSMSRHGMGLILGGVLIVSILITIRLYLLGAWPAACFDIADMALVAFLFWLNLRAARARETITLSETRLAVSRVDLRGRITGFSLQPYWLNVVLEERTGTVPRLLLCVRGRRHEVARQLGEAQKRDLAAALTRALDRWRNPRFENPQLQ